MSGTSKACTKCKEEKPVEAFHRSARNKDGRQRLCKACAAASMRQSRARRREAPDRQEFARPQAAEAADAPLVCCSFALAVAPHLRVHIEGDPGGLSEAQAETVKRLIAAHIDQEEQRFPAGVDLTGVELALSGRRQRPPTGHTTETTRGRG